MSTAGGAQVIALLVALLGVMLGLAIAPSAARAVPGTLPGTEHSRRGGVRERGTNLVALLHQMAGDVASGSSVTSALDRAVEHYPTSLPPGVTLHHGGGDLREARPAGGTHSTDQAFVLDAIVLAHSSAGSAAAVLERAATIMREREAFADERWAQAAQARLSARVLTVLPIAFAMWGATTSSRVRMAYVASPITWWLVLAGAILNGGGWWWMRHTIGTR